MSDKLHIFVDEISPRLLYTLEVMLSGYGIVFKLINDPIFFNSINGFKLVYSDHPFEEQFLTISPSSLLFEEKIREVKIDITTWNKEEIITIDGCLDPFAAVFYVLSLYEDYLDEATDEHGRRYSKNNVLVRYGLEKRLVVERWSLAFIHQLDKRFSTQFRQKEIPFSVLPTFDIDNTYAYKLKTGVRRILSEGKDLVFLDKKRLKERKEVLTGKIKDPYDTFEIIQSIHRDYFKVKLFWLVGSYGKFDRNINIANHEHQKLIKHLSEKIEIGLHPSYQSNESLGVLYTEKKRLEECLQYSISTSRQHFLKLKVPSTYQHLIKNGFKRDYTLGFPDKVGFRAGIARPFLWFNLIANTVEDFWIHPFAYMDGTLLEYLHLTPQEAQSQISELMKEVKRFGGEFSFIWHNETIGDYGKWKGWQKVLFYTLDQGKSND